MQSRKLALLQRQLSPFSAAEQLQLLQRELELLEPPPVLQLPPLRLRPLQQLPAPLAIGWMGK